MKILMFYSYKGGSGRTLAAANIAAGLAKEGKKVLILDLDIEAPGLQYVFGVERKEQLRRDGLQGYLQGSLDLDALLEQCKIDLHAETDLKYAIKDGSLFYIPATAKALQMPENESVVVRRLDELTTRLMEEQSLDFVVLDAASGVREAYTLAMDLCTSTRDRFPGNQMLIFFRWSRQHVEGTLRMIHWLTALKKYNQPWLPFKLIASATPSDKDFGSIDDPELVVQLKERKGKVQTEINQALKDCCQQIPDLYPSIYFDIPEIATMKWREHIDIHRVESSTYLQLARKLIEDDTA